MRRPQTGPALFSLYDAPSERPHSPRGVPRRLLIVDYSEPPAGPAREVQPRHYTCRCFKAVEALPRAGATREENRPRKRLVVVDDDIDLREELAAFFGGSFEVDTYPGTPAALRALREAPPDALLLDIDLQGIKGFDVLKLMNSTPDLRSAPVIVLSATNDFETFEQAHRLGIAEYVTKPFRVEALRDKLETAIDRRHRRSAGRLKLGAMLVESGLVTQSQIDEALQPPARGRRPPRRGARRGRGWCPRTT